MEASGTLKKNSEFSGAFLFMSKEALSGFWNHLEKLVEYSRIDGFVLNLAYDIIVLS